jgi:hypothetical protein
VDTSASDSIVASVSRRAIGDVSEFPSSAERAVKIDEICRDLCVAVGEIIFALEFYRRPPQLAASFLSARLPPMRLLTGRLVYATKLTCLLPNLLYFVLRPKTSERYVVDGT